MDDSFLVVTTSPFRIAAKGKLEEWDANRPASGLYQKESYVGHLCVQEFLQPCRQNGPNSITLSLNPESRQLVEKGTLEMFNVERS